MQIINPLAQYFILAAYRASTFVTVGESNNISLTDKASEFRALLFNITSSPDDSTKWKICTTYQSAKYCLDQWGNNVTQAALQPAGNYSGQTWKLTGSDKTDGSTFWRMQSDFAGTDKFLSTEGQNVVMVANATAEVMYWKIIDASTTQIAPSTSKSDPSATQTGAGQTPSPADQHESKPGPLGLILGITFGVLVIVIIVLLLLLFLLRRRRQHQQKLDANTDPHIASTRQTVGQSKFGPPSFSTKLGSPTTAVVEVTQPQQLRYELSSAVPPATRTTFHEMDGQCNIQELGS